MRKFLPLDSYLFRAQKAFPLLSTTPAGLKGHSYAILSHRLGGGWRV